MAEAVVAELAPVRERYAELRADEAALEAVLADGAEKARAIASETLADVRERDGRRAAAQSDAACHARAHARSPTLELDLEVFSGPFDLLLTLVLREEVDLLEVELADVVARLPRPPRGRASSIWRSRPSSSSSSRRCSS